MIKPAVEQILPEQSHDARQSQTRCNIEAQRWFLTKKDEAIDCIEQDGH